MSHVIAVEVPMLLVSCPDRWAAHKDIPGILYTFACDSPEHAGKHWFRFVHDKDLWTDSYIRSSWGDMTVDPSTGGRAFDTRSGSHYEFKFAPGERITEYPKEQPSADEGEGDAPESAAGE